MIPLLITTISGLSTMLGIIPTFISDKYKNKIINFSLSFSAGTMITLSFFSLLIESFYYNKNILLILIFINLGIIISIIIDKIISKKTNNTLYKVGITSLIALILHNIPEGIITFISSNNNFKLGVTLSIGIALHNIPEGISIAVPIFHATNSRKKAFLLTSISAISELFGGILSLIFFKNIIGRAHLGILYAITAGIMLQISFGELIKESLTYNNKKITLQGIIIGSIIMLLCIFYFKL